MPQNVTTDQHKLDGATTRLYNATAVKEAAVKSFDKAMIVAILAGMSPTVIARITGLNRITVYRRLDKIKKEGFGA